MADQYVVTSSSINLGTSVISPLAIMTGSTRRVVVNAFRVSFNAASATNVVVNLSRVTNTPVGTTPSSGPTPHDPAAPAALTTAAQASAANPGTWTTAPTQGVILWQMTMSTGNGGWVEYPVPGEEWDVPVSSALGLFMVASATGVVAYSQLVWTE